MKSETTHHIFYVHSNITLLAALATTQHLGITQATFLYGRGFKCDFIKVPFEVQYLSPAINKLTAIPSTGSFFLLIRYFRTLLGIDRLLRTAGQGNFSIYLPHTKNYLMQFLITNRGCKSFNILEEGLLIFLGINQIIKKTNSFYNRNNLGKLKKALKYFNHNGRTQYYEYPTASLDKIYLFFDPKNLIEIDKTKIILLKWPVLNLALPDYSNRSLFVFDNTVGEKITDMSSNLKILDSIFNTMKGEKLFIKFHPAQQDEKEILEILEKQRITYEIIDKSIPLELVFLQSKNLKVYGLLSSLLFYAKAAGHQSYSFIKYGETEDKEFGIWAHKYMPQVFFETINLL